MPRNFGVTGSAAVGGNQPPSPHIAPDITRRELQLIFPADPTRGLVAQSLIDVATILVWIVLGCLFVVAVGGPFLALGWILFLS